MSFNGKVKVTGGIFEIRIFKKSFTFAYYLNVYDIWLEYSETLNTKAEF